MNATTQLAATLPPLPQLPLHLLLNESASAAPGFSDSLTVTLQSLNLPQIQLLSALPQLSGLATAAATCKLQLGLPLPGSALKLSAMLGSFDSSVLSPLLSLDLTGLTSLTAYAAFAMKLRMLFNANPWDADLSGPLAARFGAALAPGGALHAALNVPVPKVPAVTLQQVSSLNSLISIALSLGVNLASPGGIAGFASALGPLANIALPPLRISGDLLARVSALATINSAFGLGPAALQRLPFMLGSLNALLALKLPIPNIQLATPLPTQQQLSNVVALNLPQLASLKWQVPAAPPLMSALPALSLTAQLQAILPTINLNPCASSCPLAAA